MKKDFKNQNFAIFGEIFSEVLNNFGRSDVVKKMTISTKVLFPDRYSVDSIKHTVL